MTSIDATYAVNQNWTIGGKVGYEFGRLSDDLSDLLADDEGAFINLVASF